MASPDDVERARIGAEIARIRHEALIEKWSTYVGFWAGKAFGFTSSIAGVTELIEPTLIAAEIPEPHIVAGVGFGMLTGKKFLQRISKIVQALTE